MGNKEWDNYLRDILGDFKSDGGPADWEAVARQYDAENIAASHTESLQDEAIKEKLSNYTPAGQVEGWDRIEAELDAAEAEFDQQLRSRIHSFQPPKDPNSWQAFLHSFSKHKILRAKLIAVKVFESAAVILLLLTVVHMGQLGKIPLISTPSEETATLAPESSISQESAQHAENSTQAVEPSSADNPISSFSTNKSIPDKNQPDSGGLVRTITRSMDIHSNTGISLPNAASPTASDDASSTTDPTLTSENAVSTSTIAVNEADMPLIQNDGIENNPEHTDILHSLRGEENETASNISATYITESLSGLKPVIQTTTSNPIPDPVYAGSSKKGILEFGMLVQADYNQLKLPEDRLFNNGSQVIFPLQGLTSPGYGGGFTLAIDHARWALETGLIYNSKSFKPGREITIGNGSDNSNVEFDAMHMQLVSVPLQFRYRFEPKGRLKAYALGGFGLHLITQSDIDVMVEHNFPSLSPGENPKNNPSLARTIREAERVSDDFKEKAPFSTQSYISANLGLGLEYALAARKTIFLQTAYQYQIPNLRFSNHNGKHLLSVSLQAGIRTPLGT